LGGAVAVGVDVGLVVLVGDQEGIGSEVGVLGEEPFEDSGGGGEELAEVGELGVDGFKFVEGGVVDFFEEGLALLDEGEEGVGLGGGVGEVEAALAGLGVGGFGGGLVVEGVLEGGDFAVELFVLLDLGGGGVLGEAVGVVEEFGEGAGFAAFDGEEGLFVAFQVEAGFDHAAIEGEGIFEKLLFGLGGGGPVAALFDGADGVVVTFDGDFPILAVVGEVAEITSGLEAV